MRKTRGALPLVLFPQRSQAAALFPFGRTGQTSGYLEEGDNCRSFSPSVPHAPHRKSNVWHTPREFFLAYYIDGKYMLLYHCKVTYTFLYRKKDQMEPPSGLYLLFQRFQILDHRTHLLIIPGSTKRWHTAASVLQNLGDSFRL
jgi:hypothetical protein